MIRLDQITVRLESFHLKEVSLQIATGEYAVLMGRTGSGKTTLLEAICGLRALDTGRVVLNGHDVTNLRPSERGIGYVPQDRALFHSMSVRENVAFGLRLRRTEGDIISERVHQLADLLGIRGLLDRRPAQLSGGEAQRVALGRALAIEPSLLCLDEPLSALDDDTRDEMHQLLRCIHQRTGATILHVTHHWADAQKLADKLLVLKGGVIKEAFLNR